MEEIKSYKQDINSKENTSLERIGNFIKEARLSRNQSIEELASNLKIGEHQLKAIEEGDKNQLPEEVFVKAMIRRISEKLKLDTEFIMGEFKNKKTEGKTEEINEEITEEVSNQSKKDIQAKNKSSLNFGIFILISGVFGLIASSLIFNFIADSFQIQSPKQELIQKTK